VSWQRFFRRARWDDERAKELRAHLDLEIDENIARGMSMDDARVAAYRKFGNPTLVREEIYTMNSLGWLETGAQDLKYAARVLRKNPSFTLVAVLSLALGIGANTAIFQLINAIKLQSLPVPHADRIVDIRIDHHGKGKTGGFYGSRPMMTNPLWERLRSDPRGIGRLFAWGTAGVDLADGGESRPARGLIVSGGLFDIAGVKPAAGRLLTAADDTRGCGAPPVVLNHAFWQSQFAGDPNVQGRTLQLNGATFTIAGVTEKKFFGLEVGRSFDVAIPICAEPMLRASSLLDRGDGWWLSVMGRLADGVTIESAGKQLAARSPELFAATLPPTYRTLDAHNYKEFTLIASPGGTGTSSLRTAYERPLYLLLGIAGMVLLIACGNLANLMLARANVRQAEMAVRLAIGASRQRLVRQLMVESLLLAAAGAVGGALVAGMLSRALVAFLSTPGRPVFVDLGIGWPVLGFTAGLAAITCVLFGLAPALRATKTQPAQVMRTSGRGLTDKGGRFNFRWLLVVGQMALSLVLVTGALLFAGTLNNLVNVDVGFQAKGVTQVDVDYRRAGVPEAQSKRFQEEFLAKVQALPGVSAAASAAIVPLSNSGWNETLVVDGKEQQPYPDVTRVSPEFFGVMSIPLVAGRNFTPQDTLEAPKVAIVTEAFGHAYFKTPAPVGKQFRFSVGPGQPDPTYTVVGVVKDIKYRELDAEFAPVIFFANTQETDPGFGMSIVLRGNAGAAVTRLARETHPRMLVSYSQVDETIASFLVRERLMATLSVFFGALAAVLAAIGLYGVMSYLVARRRMEIGIRLALGAGRGQLIWLFMRESAWLIAAGVSVGVVLAFYAAKASATLLFGLTAKDPAPFAIAAISLALVAALAAFLPARRGSRLAPTTALRGE
jgi:putative ABC transport system permease protein